MQTYTRYIVPAFLLLLVHVCVQAQPVTADQPRFPSWYQYQLIPNLLLYSSGTGSRMGLEWEATPLLYSWGINKKVSPWYSFIVVPTARFSGSLEWNVAVQAYSGQVGRSHFGYSTHLMAHVPLSDMGELLGMNLGVGAFGSPDGIRLFKVVGLSSAFGMLHLNVKHADRPTTWITSLEVRIY